VLNLTDTFCVTQNAVNRYNIYNMAGEAFDKPRDWTPDFKERLKVEHPELFEDGTLENRFAGIGT
jgi:hypothetical protein